MVKESSLCGTLFLVKNLPSTSSLLLLGVSRASNFAEKVIRKMHWGVTEVGSLLVFASFLVQETKLTSSAYGHDIQLKTLAALWVSPKARDIIGILREHSPVLTLRSRHLKKTQDMGNEWTYKVHIKS